MAKFGEIAHYEQFLLLPQCFRKLFAADASESICKWERVNDCLSSFLYAKLFIEKKKCKRIQEYKQIDIKVLEAEHIDECFMIFCFVLQVALFVDDLNMPQPEEYGAQPPLELLRQFLELNGFYDTVKNTWKVGMF